MRLARMIGVLTVGGRLRCEKDGGGAMECAHWFAELNHLVCLPGFVDVLNAAYVFWQLSCRSRFMQRGRAGIFIQGLCKGFLRRFRQRRLSHPRRRKTHILMHREYR